MKYLIIGGVAGGATVAARLRRLDENARIILLERGEYVSFANCGLPYYIGDTIPEREKLLLRSPEEFMEQLQVKVRTGHEVLYIHKDIKKVTVQIRGTGENYRESYDKLILSPGAEPIRPSIPGIESKHIYTMRTLSDADRIKAAITSGTIRDAVIVGGGFIGLEMAENLVNMGLHVIIIEKENQVMAPLDYSMACLVHNYLKENNVRLILANGVAGFEETGKEIRIHLESGEQITTGLVLLSIGVRAETQLARDAGLETGNTGGIKVNEYLQTSDEHIYAVGDAIEVLNPVTGKPTLIPLAGPANKQARIAANNIVDGNKDKYRGTIGTGIVKIFGHTIGVTGANAKTLKRENMAYLSSHIHPISHAGYYPGATRMSIKIMFCPDNGRLLGAQIVGEDGVDKRIDLFAQVIKNNGTIHDLTTIEHAYAPPYSSAKDPVNIAGYVAENILSGKVKIIHWREIDPADRNILLIDVRTPEEFITGSIPGSINIPLDEIRSRLDTIPQDKQIILTCAVGQRGYLAYRILDQNGYKNIYNLSGGYRTWYEANR
ncbi:MAG: FAD-dependent oxidoreductase [Tannerellaceae bacterium]|nr:FAD-dependent oxidoreductase [Tannerellaceae bacterium]